MHIINRTEDNLEGYILYESNYMTDQKNYINGLKKKSVGARS